MRHQSAPTLHQAHGRMHRITVGALSSHRCYQSMHAVPSGDATSGAPLCQICRRASLSALASLMLCWHPAAASSGTIAPTMETIADLEVSVMLTSTAVVMGPSLGHCRLVCHIHARQVTFAV